MKAVNKPKISVITWDGGFRESFHTVDFFANQTLPTDEYEFIWVEYYSPADKDLEEKIQNIHNARIVFLGKEGQWHAGQCMNEGIRNSRGELVVVPDGDVAVKPDFLEKVRKVHENKDNLVVYFRRWDEPKELSDPNLSSKSLSHLENLCKLVFPANYGGCITIRKQNIDAVAGYEEHPIFSGAGAVSRELYIRLRNAGFAIMWHPTEKIFHPWHEGSLPSSPTEKIQTQKLLINWRSLYLDIKADEKQVEEYLALYSRQSKTRTKSSYKTISKKIIESVPGFAAIARFARRIFSDA